MGILLMERRSPLRALVGEVVGDLVDGIYDFDAQGDLEDVRRRRPVWVLVDIDAPATGGLALVRRLAAASLDAQIVAVSRYGEQVLRDTARSAGASEYVLADDLLALRDILASHATKS